MSTGRARAAELFAAKRQELIDAAELRRRDFALARASGCSVPRAARLAGVSERTGWRYARKLRERSQAGL